MNISGAVDTMTISHIGHGLAPPIPSVWIKLKWNQFRCVVDTVKQWVVQCIPILRRWWELKVNLDKMILNQHVSSLKDSWQFYIQVIYGLFPRFLPRYSNHHGYDDSSPPEATFRFKREPTQVRSLHNFCRVSQHWLLFHHNLVVIYKMQVWTWTN